MDDDYAISGPSLMAIDPGNVASGFVIVNRMNYQPLVARKVPNEDLLDCLMFEWWRGEDTYIEQIGHYGTGMAAGTTVFDTCRWIGRFEQVLWVNSQNLPTLVKRATVKAHITGQAKAKDGNVAQALRDRFTPGMTLQQAKGTKDNPGFFYGFKADIWQAYALAVYALDKENGM